MAKLFFEDTVFVSDADSKEEIFKEVSEALVKQGDVKDSFFEHVIEREHNYPTGMDLSLLNGKYANIAIPHTESEYVNTTKIVPIKLNHPVHFKNMISPHNDLEVSFLFIILNSDKAKQTQLLARIMDFINSQNEEDMLKFFNFNTSSDIYNYLDKNFK